MVLKKCLLCFSLYVALSFFWTEPASKANPLDASLQNRGPYLAQIETSDILIFSPHPDDEVLAFSAVILHALAKGEKVHIVTFTHGDGFTLAAAAAFDKPVTALQPTDMLELGRLRQIEELEGVARLGLGKNGVSFLGYPDGGLKQVYETPEKSIYIHPATQMGKTYGLHQTDYHTMVHGRPAPYNKSSVISDITEIIQQLAPRQIYVTHPADTHPDHQAVFWFVRDALKVLQYNDPVYAALIHAGPVADWPRPVGATPNQSFAPPPFIGKQSKHALQWPPTQYIPMDPSQAELKHSAIEAHQSQLRLNIGLHFFESFVKKEEIFWVIDVF